MSVPFMIVVYKLCLFKKNICLGTEFKCCAIEKNVETK